MENERAQLRIADLKRQHPASTRLMNVKVPTTMEQAILNLPRDSGRRRPRSSWRSSTKGWPSRATRRLADAPGPPPTVDSDGALLAAAPDDLHNLVRIVGGCIAGVDAAKRLAGEVDACICRRLGPEYAWPPPFSAMLSQPHRSRWADCELQ